MIGRKSILWTLIATTISITSYAWAKDISVTMSVAASKENPPKFSGYTNLPDGTKLSIALIGKPPECLPRCGFGFPIVTVQKGQFSIGRELTGTEKLLPSEYTLSIDAFALGQSGSVQSVIGKKGENLRGNYIYRLAPRGTNTTQSSEIGYLPVKLPWRPDPSSEEYTLGLLVHFTQKILVSSEQPNNRENVFALNCKNYLIAYGSENGMKISGVAIEYLSNKRGNFGNGANIADYLAIECRLHEEMTIGAAIEQLQAQERQHRLPAVPVGGATTDPAIHAQRKAFDMWIHHQGPRPELRD